MPYLKNLKNQTKFFIFLFAFFLSGCSTYTLNIRPSFDENYEERTQNSAARASYKQKKLKKQQLQKSVIPSESQIQIQDDGAFFDTENIELSQKIKETSKRSGVIGGEIKTAADKYLGTPYLYGGITTNGFDCSGFVWRVFQDLGYSDFPRESAQSLFNDGKTVSRDLIREGDLCFFYDVKNRKRVGHVGIYINDGEFIHSSSSKGVIYSNVADSYWKNIFAGFKRFLP